MLCLGLFEAVAAGWFWRQALRVPCGGTESRSREQLMACTDLGRGAVSSVSLLGDRAALHEAGVTLPGRGMCGIPQITVDQ